MDDLHTTPSFKALDEGRLQPVDKGRVVTVTPEAEEAEGAAQWLEQMADRFEGEWPNTAKHCRFHVNSLRAAIAQSAEREQLIAPYIRHLAVCELDMRMGKPCSCGLTALATHQSETGAALTRDGREALRDAFKAGWLASYAGKAYDAALSEHLAALAQPVEAGEVE